MFLKKVFVGAVLLIFSAVAARAGDDVFITLTKTAEPLEKQPANVSVIGQEQIKNSAAQTAVELLKQEKGIVVRDYYANGTKAEVDLRGFGEAGASNNVVLVNGRRVNQIDMSNVDWPQIPVDQIERIEIVHGGGGVLYGDNAAGGVINIITKNGAAGTPFEFGTNFGSFNTSKATLSVNKSDKDYSYTMRANRLFSDGFRKNNKFNANDFGINSEFNLPKKTEISFGASYHSDEFGLPGPVAQADWDAGNIEKPYYPSDSAKSIDYFVQPVLKNDLGSYGRAETEISYRNRVVSNDTNSYALYDTRNITTLAAGERYFRTDEVFSRKNKLLAGVDYSDSKHGINEYLSSERAVLTKKTEISKNSLGLYLDNKFSLLDNLVLGAGVRSEMSKYNYNAVTGGSADKSELPASAYNLNLNMFYSDNSSMGVSFLKGFRTPKTDEYYTFDPLTFSVTGWNKNLKIQENSEVNFNIKHFIGKKNSVALTGFSITTVNEIFYNPSTYANENYGNTTRAGVEFEAGYQPLAALQLNAGYSYINAKFNGGMYDNKDIPAVPSQKIKLAASINIFSSTELNLNDIYVSEQRYISDQGNAFGWLPSYNVLDVKLYQAIGKVKAFIGVNNIGDAKYTDYGLVNLNFTTNTWQRYYYPAPGRNLVAGMTLNF